MGLQGWAKDFSVNLIFWVGKVSPCAGQTPRTKSSDKINLSEHFYWYVTCEASDNLEFVRDLSADK